MSIYITKFPIPVMIAHRIPNYFYYLINKVKKHILSDEKNKVILPLIPLIFRFLFLIAIAFFSVVEFVFRVVKIEFGIEFVEPL